MIKFIVHGSQKRLARALRRATRGKMPRLQRPILMDYKGMLPEPPQWGRDIFLVYPEASNVRCAEDQKATYTRLAAFFRMNKREQWYELRKYFKTPEIEKPPYVVRPLHHEGGVGFEIVNELPPKEREATHYWRSLWERSCEYRVIFIRGKKALVLLKDVPENTPQNIPWNHGVSSFVTVHNHDNDRLRHSKFYECAEKFFADYPFDVLAVDVLYRKQRHRVVEVNFGPGIHIPENQDLIINTLLAHGTSGSNQSLHTNVSARPTARPLR